MFPIWALLPGSVMWMGMSKIEKKHEYSINKEYVIGVY